MTGSRLSDARGLPADLRHLRSFVVVAEEAHIGRAATRLASERTANVTGANYVIDGGVIKTT